LRFEPSKYPESMQHFLKSKTGTAGTKIIPPKLLRQLLYRRAPRGNPRLTFVSDGNPLRRLLLGSNQNSLFMAFSFQNGLPVTSERKAVSQF
jgi:hypothetical protein